jgi:hypothetical protein
VEDHLPRDCPSARQFRTSALHGRADRYNGKGLRPHSGAGRHSGAGLRARHRCARVRARAYRSLAGSFAYLLAPLSPLPAWERRRRCGAGEGHYSARIFSRAIEDSFSVLLLQAGYAKFYLRRNAERPMNQRRKQGCH